jgi:hypothetical protein
MKVLLWQQQPFVRWKFRQLPSPIVTSLWVWSEYRVIQTTRRQRNQLMLCDELPQHVISRHGDVQCSAGSPDLSGCDCFLEGYFWRKVPNNKANRGAPPNSMRRNLGDPRSKGMPHTVKLRGRLQQCFEERQKAWEELAFYGRSQICEERLSASSCKSVISQVPKHFFQYIRRVLHSFTEIG